MAVAKKKGRGRQGAGVAAPPGPVRVEDAPWWRAGTSSSTRSCRELPRPGRATGLDASGGAAVPHVHQRDDRAAQGRPAFDRRVLVLRRRHFQVLPRHPPRRHLLVFCRHRLDNRPFLHRLRAARPWHNQRALRGRALPTRTRPARGGSPSASASISSTPRRPRSACCASSARTSRQSTITTSS